MGIGGGLDGVNEQAIKLRLSRVVFLRGRTIRPRAIATFPQLRLRAIRTKSRRRSSCVHRCGRYRRRSSSYPPSLPLSAYKASKPRNTSPFLDGRGHSRYGRRNRSSCCALRHGSCCSSLYFIGGRPKQVDRCGMSGSAKRSYLCWKSLNPRSLSHTNAYTKKCGSRSHFLRRTRSTNWNKPGYGACGRCLRVFSSKRNLLRIFLCGLGRFH